MALDQAFVGRSYPPTPPYLVSREKIAEFAAAVGDPNPAYTSVEAARALGHRDVVAPPTFAVLVTSRAQAQVLFDPELGLDYSKVVHGEQGFVHWRPIVAGDSLTVVASVQAIRSAAGNDLVTIATKVSDAAGEPVCESRATVVARGTASEGEG